MEKEKEKRLSISHARLSFLRINARRNLHGDLFVCLLLRSSGTGGAWRSAPLFALFGKFLSSLLL